MQRTDLVDDVVAGDVPLCGGLDTMKLAAGVLARSTALVAAQQRASALLALDVVRDGALEPAPLDPPGNLGGGAAGDRRGTRSR